MKSSLNSAKKSLKQASKKIVIFLLVFVMLFSFLIIPLSTAKAQMSVTDAINASWTAGNTIWQKITNTLKTLLLKGGAMAFQQVVRTALNKIAYDTANYLGSGGKGQKPLFITANWGDYLAQVGDEAAGQFVESFAANLANPISAKCQKDYQECAKKCLSQVLSVCENNEACIKLNNELLSNNTSYTTCIKSCKQAASSCDNQASLSARTNAASSSSDGSASNFNQASFNVCQPSSLEAKVKIGLALVEQQRPGGPNCTASTMIQNWGDEAQKLTDFKDPQFLNKFKNIFDPNSSDLGIYMSARTDMINKQVTVNETSKVDLTSNQGWRSVTNIAKKTESVPGNARRQIDNSTKGVMAQIGKTTGDIVIDAANVFVNQFATTAFNNLMSQLGKKASEGGTDSSDGSGPNLVNKNSDPNITYGEGNLKEITSSIIKPDFGVRADYDILSQLVICPDPKNPGPTNCVIDEKMMQGITENKTVAEAIKDGYIHADWQLSKDTVENTYSLRNVSILRKYRILPIGWEEAINRAEASSTKVTINDLISCFDPADSYNQFSSSFNVSNQTWCQGLVDPNWVLKAPLNYCRKEGSSAQIMSTMVIPSIPGISSNPYTPSTLNIVRAEDYCADEQTCIKEKDNGSCEVYGYCNEEKRTWNFTTDTCEPINNTCQSFTNPITGKSVSYLENTLNYSGCSPESAGCRQYSVFGTFATSTGTVNWEANKSIYLNKNTSSCNGKDEGCTELLRVKPTWGSNLVMDADYNNDVVGASSTGKFLFNTWPYWSSSNSIDTSRVATIVDASQEPGGTSGKALKLEVTRIHNNTDVVVVGTYSNLINSLLPENFQLIPGQSYTVSADVYLAEGHMAHLYLGDVNDGFVKSTDVLNKWEHLSVTRVASGSFSEQLFGVNADNIDENNVKVYIKNLKFEVSDFATSFNAYGAYKVYEKLLPSYLEKACYMDVSSATKDYRLRSDAPAVCSTFARKCNRNEVGCEMFTNTKNGLGIPAQVTSADYCPGECVGYDAYISKEDNFNSQQSENMIPKTAKDCNLESAGCSEFTNLDALAQGGEKKEYYSFLKQCIKPDQILCGNFYSWEGTDSGYQLRSYSLKKLNQNGVTSNEPSVTMNDSALCNATIYNKPLGDPQYNSDCREFYNSSGQVSYHLISKTVTCSDNCHAYRMSDKNIDKTVTQAQCNASPTTRHWDANLNVCYVCLNGGTWDNQLGACIYQAIPGEGKTCNAEENGCREYNGNDGNNVRMLSYYDFESGSQGWNSNCPNGLQLTTISSNKNGHSLLYKDSANGCSAVGIEGSEATAKQPLIKQVFASSLVAAQLRVSSLVTEGKAYNLRFIAKAAADTSLQVYFYNNDAANPKKAYFATSTLLVKGGGDWNIYQTNLENLDHAISPNELLIISADHDFYFDNVVLTEITDRYYLIKNTSQIPDICYYDNFDKYQGAEYNLGCAQYTDRSNLIHNLHKFSKLCSDSAVGCEQMIATQNYTPYKSGLWNDTNKNEICDSGETDCLKVNGDAAIYAVFDSNKQCNNADLGCSRLGQGSLGGTAWSDVYKKNNPNLYDKILCSSGEVGCEEWSASDGTLNYFRDPGNETCQYRASHDLSVANKDWYKIPVLRCDLNSNGKIEGTEMTGKICSTANDCASKPCIIDTNDYPCATSFFKTFGLGGAGNQLPIPSQQAGLCDANASGCSEYIDPVSRFSPNLVYNPGYTTSDGWGTVGVLWNGVQIKADEQVVIIEPNKLYIFSTKNNTGGKETRLDFPNEVKKLLINNTLGTSTNSIIIPAQTNQSILFSSVSNSKVKIKGGEATKIIEIKTAVINYQLQENIDRASCNGVVNFDNGCVLFNERSVNGSSGLTDLSEKWDAAASPDKQAPVNCDKNVIGSCTANQLIKVRPNRTCSKWLDCLTYVQDPATGARTCYAVGECTRLNDKNECANFEEAASGTIAFDGTGSNKNASGYYLLNKYHLSNMQEVGLNSEVHYDFEDTVPTLSCERADSSNSSACAFNKNIVTDLLIREPEKASGQADYPAHGTTYLKVPAAYLVSPQSLSGRVTLVSDTDYYINFLVNTKGSGLGAKLIIKNKAVSNNIILNKTYSANNGWERQVVKFHSPKDDNGVANSIKIYLGASDYTKEGNVYFDDINIEPVLQIAGPSQTKQYVTRECRLYPSNDSLTCVNKNNNVTKDGWEGYCLEHDPNNRDVCLMWYPVDAISSAQTTRNALGYQGKFPLSYCTEVNGNFDLVEKRVETLVAVGKNCYDAPTTCYYGSNIREIGESWSWYRTGVCNIPHSATPNVIKMYCGSKAVGKYWVLERNVWGGLYFFCEPAYLDDPTQNLLSVKEKDPKIISGKQCGENGGDQTVGAWSGWYRYDGLDNNNDANFAAAAIAAGDIEFAGTYTFDESKNADPPVRVFDWGQEPADEEGLKTLSGKDPENVFRLTCNRFAQVVDNNGDNKAWASRTGLSSIYPNVTPAYFIDEVDTTRKFFGTTTPSAYTEHQISVYGRNREDVPFGAAVWPDSFSLLNSEPIKLKNQYSKKNNEDIFAGRPYGCYNGTSGSGCGNIGYCSIDPSIYCIVTDNYDINRKSCADGGYGVCVPIWAKSLEVNTVTDKYDFKNILKTLFLKTYSSYYFDGNSYSSDHMGGYNFIEDPNSILKVQECKPRPVNTYTSSTAINSFCPINPSVGTSTTVVKYGSQVIYGPSFNIPKKGVYSLEFTTFVDSEQQPLKKIFISWGDGTSQVITGQDNRPDSLNPHVFYHYYKSAGSKNINIKINDNWGAEGEYYYNSAGPKIIDIKISDK